MNLCGEAVRPMRRLKRLSQSMTPVLAREMTITLANGRKLPNCLNQIQMEVDKQMLYLLSLFIPPLGVLLAGRIFTGIILLIIWIPAVVLFFLSHIIFVVIAWIIIASAKGDRRHKEILKSVSRK